MVTPPPDGNLEGTSPDGGKNLTKPFRFGKASDLKSRYEDVRTRRGSMTAWTNILRQYERLPYRDKQGNIKGNFGQLRYKVDQALTTFVDFATEREQWARIVSDEGDEDAQSKKWSEDISAAFNKFCIKPWKKSAWEVMMSAKDMLMFNNGVLGWEDDHSAYPHSVPTETVWPDAEAGQFPEDWDLCFIEKRFTAVELWMKVEDPTVAAAHGWNREAVLRLLKSSNDCFKDQTIQGVFDQFRMGSLADDIQDFHIDVVIGLVREYHEAEGNRISKFVFVRESIPGKKGKGGVKKPAQETEYLLDKRQCITDMGQAIAVLNQTPARNFYENTSFAQLVYTTAKQYDILMNRILEAIEDNMRVFIKSDNPEQLEKLQRMRMGIFQILDPEVTIEQDRIQRPVKDAADVLRMVMVDQNVGTGQYQVGQTNIQGGAKTATQSEIDLAESTKISAAHLKLFNLFMTMVMAEIYRRFTTTIQDGDENFHRFRKFKAFLEKRGVPAKAWKVENVVIESVISLGAGSPAAKIQGGRLILETLASPSRSPGERQAKRDIISAVVGVENVESYLPRDEQINIPEDSLIGLENDALSQPFLNPANVIVHPDHLHMRHIPRHLDNMVKAMGIAEALFQNRDGLNPDDAGVILQTVTDILIGVDNTGAHVVAHMNLSSQGANESIKQQLQQLAQVLNEVNKRQDKMQQVIGEVQQARLQEARERNGTDPELQHKETMFRLKEQHEERMLNFGFNKEILKAEQLRTQSAANARLKQQLELEKAQSEIEGERLRVTSDVQNNRLKAVTDSQTQSSNGNQQ